MSATFYQQSAGAGTVAGVTDPLTFITHDQDLSIVRLPPGSPVPAWLPADGFVSVTRTGEELSVVCPSASASQAGDAPVESGWLRLEMAGPFDLTLTGVLASALVPLAGAGVSIFALSTYDTDHVLVRRAQLSEAVAALRAAGHEVRD